MSGIEVVGLVLGGIPLVISGLEHYEEGVRTIRLMWRAPAVFRDLKRRMRLEGTLLRNSMEHLLRGSIDDMILEEYLDSPRNRNMPLSNETVDDALKKKLRKSYDQFVETMTSLNDAVATLQARLRLDDEGKGPFDINGKDFRSAYRKFRFGLEASAYEDIMIKISRDNNYLSEITKHSMAMEPISKKRKVSLAKNLAERRSYLAGVFCALQTGVSQSCQAAHQASFGFRDAVGIASRGEQAACRILLQHKPAEARSADSISWAVEELEMRLVRSKSSPHVDTIQHPDCAHSTKIQKSRTSKVRFQDVPAIALPLRSMPLPDSNIKEIRDLCEMIQLLPRNQKQQCDSCLGYLVDKSTRDEYALYQPLNPIKDSGPIGTLTLAEILASQSGKLRLTLAESRRLAATVASGMLQLHGTPWLGTQWGRNEVTFFVKSGKILAEHPFISSKVRPSSLCIRDEVSYFDSDVRIRNETVFALGILLIELCFRKPFTDLIIPTDVVLNPDQSKHPATNYQAAKRLSAELYQESTTMYADAARRCIHGSFDVAEDTLDSKAFCEAIENGVVGPLLEDVLTFSDHL